MRHIQLYESYLMTEASLPEDKIVFTKEADIKVKKNVIRKVKELLRNKDLPKIVSAEISISDRGVYSGDGENTAIKFITEKGNEIIYKFLHKDKNGIFDVSGEKRPCLIFINTPKEGRIRYDYWGKENDLKEIEKKNIQIPTKDDVKKAAELFYDWLKKVYDIDPSSYSNSDNSNYKDYLKDGRYPAEIYFGGYQRIGKSVRVTIKLAEGTAELMYGNHQSNIVSDRKYNSVNIKIKQSMNLVDILESILKSKIWKTIGTEADAGYARYAKSYSEYIRSGGSLD